MRSEITKEMYDLAKQVVDSYEKKDYHMSHRLIDFSKIKFNKRWYQSSNGKEVKYDWNSREPSFVAYNTVRLKIYQANYNGKRQLETPLSTSVARELELDGYKIKRNLIEW